LSIVGFAGVIVGVPNAGFTVTASHAEDADLELLSVTT
jgi:hypothetical protein